MEFTKKNYVDLTGLSTFKSSLLDTVINDTNKATTSKTATIKAIADYVDSEVEDLSSAVTAELAKKVSSVTYDSTNKKLVYNKGGSTNTDIVTVATLKSAIGNFVKSGSGASAGLVPAPSTTAGTSKYLREDGTWVVPTDTKVTQNAVTDSDYTNFRPLIFGSSNSGTAGFTPSTVTDGVYACKGLYVRPSAGLIHATTFEGTLSDVNKVKVAGKVTLQYNSSTESLDFVFA